MTTFVLQPTKCTLRPLNAPRKCEVRVASRSAPSRKITASLSAKVLSSRPKLDSSFGALQLIDTHRKLDRTASVKVAASSSETESSSGPVAALFAKYPRLETGLYFAIWYLLNIKFNILNKEIYGYFPYPWFVSCVHLAAGVVIAAFFWATRIVKFEAPDKTFLHGLGLVAFCHAVGHSLTNVSFASVAVSFTHTVKTLEPVFSSIFSYGISGTVYSLPVYLSLIPIMAGVAICSATELSFTWLGFSTAMTSNILFAARAVFSKKLMSGMNPINVYNYVSMAALLICIPPAIYFEGGSLAAGMADAAAKVGSSRFYWDLWNVGMFYHLYNQVAYQALGKVEPVTHAVGNVGKRIFVIGFSIIYFGNKISMQSVIGSAIAIAGAGLYGYLKGKDAQKATAAAAV
eukprot:CAMPEP_0196598744 /NCGR_PEP_ID=MMETSP1081-20130531/94483_1 /TAXON_ID=36882 /ORGANISM="Pyramimonas amylifera, Strain CCMP720" /LENGTH=402 /DNA_ID=CAMNT_0041924463 /DNA_START=97 /DNA_END=1305 /DNA_ORIENTATION=+